MTSRRARAAAATEELNRRRRPAGSELTAADDPTRSYRVDRFVLEVRDLYGFGAPRGEEYEVTGWLSSIADRAQDFEGGTIYLDTMTECAGFLSWRAYNPLTAATGSPGAPVRAPDEDASRARPALPDDGVGDDAAHARTDQGWSQSRAPAGVIRAGGTDPRIDKRRE